MWQSHADVTVSKSGLCVDIAHPFLGATIDGIVNCGCCGKGGLEIKCPYSCRETAFAEAGQHFFLKKDNDGQFHLDVKHSYYYQVQAQIKLCSVEYCDFVVWREEELFVQRILPDTDLIMDAISKCEQFIKLAVLPEMLGKWYTKKSTSTITVESTAPGNIGSMGSPAAIEHPKTAVSMEPESEQEKQQDELWCYCRTGESGEMICCDSKSCKMQWFHTTCLHITKIPKGFAQIVGKK